MRDRPAHRSGASQHRATQYKLDQTASVATVAELTYYDAIVIGTPTRFGRMSLQTANFLDQAGGDGSRQPSDDELMCARYQGRRIAEVAKRLHS